MKSRFRLALAGLAAAAALAAPEEAASAAEAPHGSWHVVYTQAGAASSSFEQAVAVSGRHAWMLGASGSTSFVMAWDGKAWSRMKALPAGLEANMIAASSPSDVWVFGRFADQAVSRALRWNGQRWISLAWRGCPGRLRDRAGTRRGHRSFPVPVEYVAKRPPFRLTAWNVWEGPHGATMARVANAGVIVEDQQPGLVILGCSAGPGLVRPADSRIRLSWSDRGELGNGGRQRNDLPPFRAAQLR